VVSSASLGAGAAMAAGGQRARASELARERSRAEKILGRRREGKVREATFNLV
jgi:hypothetical protein